MKKINRILCLALAFLLAISGAVAETADTANTLPKKFLRQLTGGNGLRGKISLTASGVAEWLNVLLPFTAADIQIHAMGEKQGDLYAETLTDDNWQIKLFTENSNEQEVGTTWIYGDKNALYISSELLPDTLLTIPVEQVNLLYQIFRGEYADLFFAFDPFSLTQPGTNGNASAYEAVAKLLGVSEQVWADNWLPVLEKYFVHLDQWLTAYGTPAFVTGEEGSVTVSVTYTIPADALKAEAKYLVGQMLYDSELMTLLTAQVSPEVRDTYLNPSMIYYYEACIDALALQGDVILTRALSAQGETVHAMVALPLPALPQSLTQPIGQLAADAFGLPYTDLLDGMNRVSFTQDGGEMTIALTGTKRSLAVTAAVSAVDENTTGWSGSLRVSPNVGVTEDSLSARYTCTYGQRQWQDESYVDHDQTSFALTIEPDLDMLSSDDPFRNLYVDFSPLHVELSADYRNNSYKENSPAQVNVSAAVQLPDAEVAMELVLRITTKLTMTTLPTAGAERLSDLSAERKAALVAQLTENAVNAMSTLNAAQPESTVVPAADTPDTADIPDAADTPDEGTSSADTLPESAASAPEA